MQGNQDFRLLSARPMRLYIIRTSKNRSFPVLKNKEEKKNEDTDSYYSSCSKLMSLV